MLAHIALVVMLLSLSTYLMILAAAGCLMIKLLGRPW